MRQELLLLTQCCVCKKFKDEKGQYRVYLPVCPFLRVSHGYCEDCIKDIDRKRDERLSKL